MTKLDDNALDTTKLDDGVWWDYDTKAPCPGNVPHATHGCFLIVPHLGSGFDGALAEEQLPYLEVFRKKADPDEQTTHTELVESTMRRCIAKAAAKTLLRGWANWEKPDGATLVWSEDEATKLMLDRRYLAYADFVGTAARSTEAALMREEESAKGN